MQRHSRKLDKVCLWWAPTLLIMNFLITLSHDFVFLMNSRSRRLALLSLLVVSTSAFIIAADESSEKDPFARHRRTMVDQDIRARGIRDQKVLAAMLKVPRHLFVDEHLQGRAYADHPLPIAEGQTISQPYVVALMTEKLRLKPGDRVLEIGTGSGYQAAVLAEIAKEVYTIEIRKGLAELSAKRLRDLGCANVQVRHGDGYFGWEEKAPFDAIMITAAANHIPPPLIKQLKEGGRMILPLGSTVYFQTLTLATKKKGELDVEQLTAVRFVPMVGEVEK